MQCADFFLQLHEWPACSSTNFQRSCTRSRHKGFLHKKNAKHGCLMVLQLSKAAGKSYVLEELRSQAAPSHRQCFLSSRRLTMSMT